MTFDPRPPNVHLSASHNAELAPVCGLDRRARLAHERDGPFEGAFSFAQSLISPRFSTS